MIIPRPFLAALLASTILVAPSAVGAQGDSAPTTDLTFTGEVNDEVTGSDTNACVLEDGDLRGQLASPGAASILSFNLANAAVGSYPIGGADPTLTMITLSDSPDELLVNWYGKSGTLTIASLDSQVPVGDGTASTRGAAGSIDADISADKHGTVHISGSWACHMPF
ncbi:MAG TPA: hypothetical protein VF937_08775 [Chloroflexota bacterium]